MATRRHQTLTDGTRMPWMAGLEGSLAFYSDIQSQAHFSFSPNNVTAQSRHCSVPLPSATLQATSPFHHHTRLFSCGSKNSSLCLLHSWSEWKFLSKKKNSERQTKRLYKGARYSEHCGWITTVRPGWNRFFQVTKQKRALSPYPEAYVSFADKFWTLSLWWTFQLVWWGMVPVASHLLVFHMELLLRDSLKIPAHKRPDLLWMKTALWRGEWWFLSFPTISPIPRYSNTAMAHPLLTISPENWPDPLCFPREMHVDMWSRSIPHHPA